MEVNAVYIHIPFCQTICSYCDFCKVLYYENWVDDYLVALEKEILNRYQNEMIETIYIGGGTPSALTVTQLQKLLEITKLFRCSNKIEFTIECNVESINEEKLKLFKNYGVNRISYGVQTFHSKYLAYLNRYHTKEEVIKKIKLTKKYFSNINIDLMYAFKEETLKEVEEDIEEFMKLEIPHISTYSLIIEPHTILGLKENYIDDTLDERMYEVICSKLKRSGYHHYEVSNFSKLGYESKHNLTYWNNLYYYGFGLGASGYLDHMRYTNTRSLNRYLKGLWNYSKEDLTQQEEMEYEFILGLRKRDGVSLQNFYNRYHKQAEEVFPISSLIQKGLLEVQNGYVKIKEDKIYLSNEVLIYFIGEK